MKIKFTLLFFYLFITLISVLSVFSDFYSLVFLGAYLILFIKIHFKEAFTIEIRSILFFPVLISAFVLPFIFPDKIVVFNFLPISIEGYIFFLRFSLRFLLFLSAFSLFTFVFSPRIIVQELSKAGFVETGFILGIAFNQLYYFEELIKTIWNVMRQRKRYKKMRISDFFIFLKAVMKHSLRRSEQIAFSIYASKSYTKINKKYSEILKKKDYVLLIHTGIIIFVLMGLIQFR
ncbi:MAG: energy-coupling factor transporter transmembrane component T [Candidatus Muiribacteriota bacterium]